MSERQTPRDDLRAELIGFDRELHLRPIVWVGLATALVSALAIVAMIYFNRSLAARAAATDPAPSTFARDAGLPPEPRLQVAPERDLAAVRAAEHEQLASYGWVDRGAGVAHIPIDRALDLTLERGAAALAAPAPAPTGGVQ